MVTEAECLHELDLGSCGLCRPRPGAVDLHRTSARTAGSSWAAEVVASVTHDGERFGLVPSGGTAYVFGTGTRLHHRRECYEGSDTPDDRVVLVADPNGDVWRTVLDRRSAGRKVVNVAGQPVTGTCSSCALRPESW